jgi:hypothetical protein
MKKAVDPGIVTTWEWSPTPPREGVVGEGPSRGGLLVGNDVEIIKALHLGDQLVVEQDVERWPGQVLNANRGPPLSTLNEPDLQPDILSTGNP